MATTPNPDRRNERARRAILDAALELCSTQTYAGLTMEGIAKSAGVGKQTIYRWWPSKAAILLEAITERADQSLDFPDTGDLLADLRGQMYELVRLFTDPMFGAYGRGLIVAAQTDPAISAALLDTLIRPRVQLCIERLAKAQQAGEIRADVDLAVVVELLYAPLYYRMLLHTAPVSSEQVDSVISLVMSGIRP
ncbi:MULTISPECIES: TetR/AcrR family transcriptional regulator [Kribbella]|uniref:TetR/AcrR family transcriptional regulator n=1 Tax=Kribbella karoonensis TaxID=324851 RepID=A0ABN2DWW2_9ACTN